MSHLKSLQRALVGAALFTVFFSILFAHPARAQSANTTTFEAHVALGGFLGVGHRDLELKDLDNDGDLDVMFSMPSSLWCAYNDGTGEFSSFTEIGTGSSVRAIEAVDMNGDGLMDYLLGDNGTNQTKLFLTDSLPATFSDTSVVVVDIAQNHYATAVLLSDGTVETFGHGSYGGQGAPAFPSPVVELGSGGVLFSARMEDGQVYTWGENCCGDRNNSWYANRLDFSIGRCYGVAVNPDSSLAFIGCNSYGVGNLPQSNDYTRVWTSSWEHYWAGAIRADGSLEMWGRNVEGSTEVPDGLGPVVDADGGSFWTLALLADSTIAAWGYNEFNAVSSTPSLTNVTAIACGHHHGLALDANGEVHAWGYGGEGQLALPVFEAPVVKIGAGIHSSWAIDSNGKAYFWGYNNSNMTSDAMQAMNPGTFVSALNTEVAFASGMDVHAVQAADFDGDGQLDVLVGGCGDGNLKWFGFDGVNTFDDGHAIAESIGCVTSAIAVDIDLDGDKDVAVFANNGQLSWFENIAQGIFGPQNLIATWGNGWNIDAHDANDDGYPDLFIKHQAGNFRVYINPGPVGDWAFAQESGFQTGGNSERAFWVGNVVGDDGLDVLTSVHTNGYSSIELSRRVGTGWDLSYSIFEGISTGGEFRGLAAGDVNGDGATDVVFCSTSGALMWLEQKPASAVFGLQETIDPAHRNMLGLAHADFDGDGDLDLVTADHGYDDVRVYLNLGNLTWSDPLVVSDVDTYRVETGDVDGDGTPDILVAGGDSDRVEYILSNGDGTFQAPVIVSTLTNTVWGISGADLDNDGDLDLVTASRDDDKFAWYKNLGGGNFGPQQLLTILIDQPFDVATGDMDGDGDIDILGLTLEGGDRLVWFENLGGGLFGQYEIIESYGGNPHKLHAADLDGDGLLDVLTANEQTDEVAWVRNLGGGNFAGRQIIGRKADGCQSVYTCDADGDGDLDVVSASGNNDQVAWYENLGGGAFGHPHPLTMAGHRSNYYRAVTAFDADGDGAPEIFAGGELGLDMFQNVSTAVPGCTDEAACNYSPAATLDDGCQYGCYGCTIEAATNYNAASTIDDGSCLIPIEGCSSVSGLYTLCTANSVDTTITYCPDVADNSLQMTILSGALENMADYLFIYDGNSTSDPVIGNSLTDQLNGYEFVSTSESGCLTLRVVTDVSLSCADGFFNPIKYNIGCGFEAYQGCTDPASCNYNAQAVIDDGTCATEDCTGACGGLAIEDPVCGACVDVAAVTPDLATLAAFDLDPLLWLQDFSVQVDTFTFGPTGQIETWAIPAGTAAMHMTARGAQGGNVQNRSGGLGTTMSGWFSSATSSLDILVGMQGGTSWNAAGGGGGSFIASANQPLLVAGGGGGPGEDWGPSHATVSESGNNGYCAAGGHNGEGGLSCGHSGAGGGFFTNGQGPNNGASFLEGGGAGWGPRASGGFGGGGGTGNGAGGAGGGYSGGGGGSSTSWGSERGGGGGGSYNAGLFQENSAQTGYGDGWIQIITYRILGTNCTPGCMDAGACNFNALAVEEDGTCEYTTCTGCMDAGACNFDADASIEDNTECEYLTCAGCLDPSACNFDAAATLNAFDCTYPEPFRDCAGNCLVDSDGDGVCDGEEVAGCTYAGADNYNPAATDENGSCTFVGSGIDEVFGCTYPNACNYDGEATADDATCTFPEAGYDCAGACLADADGDGICDEYEGCTNPGACNYQPSAQDNDGSCWFPEPGLNCQGECAADSDGDGICDPFEIPGCTDPNACNYAASATDENGSCTYPEPGFNCAGYCLQDYDGDGVCDVNEIEGCMHSLACNFNPNATENDGSCVFAETYYDCDGNCEVDLDGDGVCDQLEITGCTYAGADNFNPNATDDDGTCIFLANPVPGCIYPTACNFQPDATSDDGSCIFPALGYTCSGTCIVDTDADGVCDIYEIVGCQDPAACNYNSFATDPDTCNYLTPGADCEGNCYFDANNDGVCDELAGCTNTLATNYDPAATTDDGSCLFSCTDCAPVFTEPIANSTVSCWDELPATPPVHFAISPCDSTAAQVVSNLIASSDDPCTGFRTFQHLALNLACGNFTIVFETISVAENSAPEFVSLPEGLVLACDGELDFGEPGVVDACTDVNLVIAEEWITGDCPSNHTVVRTLVATDVCGNTSTASYSVEIVDEAAPSFANFPADVVIGCDDDLPALVPTVVDNCSDWTLSSADEEAVLDCPGNSIITRTFTAVDACGNSVSQAQTIERVDVVAPVITFVPADAILSCTDEIAADFGEAVDACNAVTLEFEDTIVPGDCPATYDIHRTHRATDECGNTSEAVQVIAIADTTAPAFAGPSVTTSSCEAFGEALMQTEDDCSEVDLTYVNVGVVQGTIAQQEIRVYTALDACGNTATQVQLIAYEGSTECGGCTNPTSPNYDSDALFDDGSCTICACAEGTEWSDELGTCIISESTLIEACGQGTYWSSDFGVCLPFECPGDLNADGSIGTADLLLLLVVFGSECQ